MKKITFILLAAAMMMAGCKQMTEPVAADTDNIYQFSVLDGNLDTVSLSDYQGKVLLVVNTATQCGFTPQYEDLQQLYAKYHDRGFEVLDFPCNQFGEQAPGSYEEIHGFCTMNYNITFPQMAKIEVNGEGEEPLYTWLKGQARLDQMFRQQDSLYDQNPDIKWNFTKFLIGRNGKVLKRFEPTAKMNEIEAAIESEL